jgi:calcium channel MID1
MSTLVDFYDNNAQSLYQNFSLSLQQVACNTTSSSQYSLARNCNDCQNDYKTWLCAVTIPRCDDFSSSSPNLMPRNIAQQQLNNTTVDLAAFGIQSNATKLPWFSRSRSLIIDQQIKPGPYRELLPCIDLCYEMVKSCPAVMGFGCPRQVALMNKSYGIFDSGISPPSCNFLGRDTPTTNSSPRRIVPMMRLLIAMGVLHWILVW